MPSPSEERPCASFEEAHTRYHRPILARALRRLRGDESAAEDVLQNVWVRVDRCIQRENRVPYPLLPMLYRLADNELHDHLRAEKRRRCDGPPDSGIPASKPDPEQLVGEAQHRAELARQAEAVYARMAESDVQLIKLARGGMPLQEIADRAGVSEGALRARLCRARARFVELYRSMHGSRSKT